MVGNKSEQAKKQSTERLAKQKERGSTKFAPGSNKHQGASRSQSGQQTKKK